MLIFSAETEMIFYKDCSIFQIAVQTTSMRELRPIPATGLEPHPPAPPEFKLVTFI